MPGYILLPKNASEKKSPAILYCHWHGGQYDIGKEELFQTNHTPQAPGPTFAKRGLVVLGVDSYCFGERNGRGPGGPEEKGRDGEMTASKFQLWVGRTLWGMIVRDDQMAPIISPRGPRDVDPHWCDRHEHGRNAHGGSVALMNASRPVFQSAASPAIGT